MIPSNLLARAQAAGVPLRPEAAHKLADFLPIFLETNAQINLSAPSQCCTATLWELEERSRPSVDVRSLLAPAEQKEPPPCVG